MCLKKFLKFYVFHIRLMKKEREFMTTKIKKMKSSKRANVINGWVVIDKAKNTTSSYVTARTKKILHAKKAGHAGTLDPLGTGVLPIALGEATKTISYVVDKFKHYKFTVRWGEERDSYDAEGAVINVSNERPCEEEIRSALCNFTGEIDQIPPRYSALKINGERAYKVARAGREFNLPSRKVLVKKFSLLDFPNANFAECDILITSLTPALSNPFRIAET